MVKLKILLKQVIYQLGYDECIDYEEIVPLFANSKKYIQKLMNYCPSIQIVKVKWLKWEERSPNIKVEMKELLD